MLMVPSPSHVTTHFVHLDRIAVRLDRPNNILNNAYCSLCSSERLMRLRWESSKFGIRNSKLGFGEKPAPHRILHISSVALTAFRCQPIASEATVRH